MQDISKNLINDGINLETYAKDKFGAYTLDNSKMSGLNLPSSNDKIPMMSDTGAVGVWDPTPYSSTIASGAGDLDPKIKFLFNVEFQFDEKVAQQASSFGIDPGVVSRNLTFVVKQIDLPKFEFSHEEVNQYNFRTRILKQISHKELSMSFLDDVGNNALNLLNLYLKVMSPITRGIPSTNSPLGDHGMDFSTNYQPGLDSAIRGVLPGDTTVQVIRLMKVHQIYTRRSTQGNLNNAVFFNTFTFTNPRIMSFDISDQDHESSAAFSIVSAQFDYDALNIETGKEGKLFNGILNPAGDIFGRQQGGQSISSGTRGLPVSGSPSMEPSSILSANSNYNNSFSPNADRASLNNSSFQSNPLLKSKSSTSMAPLQNAIYKTLTGQSAAIAQALALPRVSYVTDNSTSVQAMRTLTKKITSR